MPDLDELQDLIAYLERTTRLSQAEARRIVEEVLGFLQETPEEYVCRRHLALQARGLMNSEIYSRLADELASGRFRAPKYSLRQIRRMIYG
jgi:hypothetical protein